MIESMHDSISTADREMTATRLIDAPRAAEGLVQTLSRLAEQAESAAAERSPK
jgi:hypothetical protein